MAGWFGGNEEARGAREPPLLTHPVCMTLEKCLADVAVRQVFADCGALQIVGQHDLANREVEAPPLVAPCIIRPGR